MSLPGRKIEDKTVTRFWELVPLSGGDLRFSINQEHPLYLKLLDSCTDEELLTAYLNGLQAYLPLEAIQSNLQQHPHKIKQETSLSEEQITELAEKLKSAGLSPEYIESLLKAELFKNRTELFKNGK